MCKDNKYIWFCFVALLVIIGMADLTLSVESQEDRASLGMALSFNNLGQYDKSIPMLQKLHKKYPNDSEIAVELAKAFGFSGNAEKAEEILNSLMMSEPQNRELQLLFANIMEANQQFDKARQQYLDLQQQEPNDKLIIKIAELSSWLKDYPTSIEYYKQALDKSADDRQIHLKLADMYFWSSKYEQAIKYYSISGIGPEKEEKRFENLGYCYLNTKQYLKAIDVFERLSKKAPEKIDFKIALANVYYSRGQIDEALGQFKKIVELEPTNADAVVKLAEIYATKKEYQKAIDICKQFLRTHQGNKKVLLLIARIQSWNKKYQESLNNYDELIKAEPDWLLPRREKARVLGWTRRYRDAIDEYQKAIDSSPDESVVIDEKKAKYGFYNYYDKQALKYYDRWLESEPDNLEALYDMGQVYSRQSKWEDAGKMYRGVLDIFPNHFRAAQALKKVDIYSNRTKFKTGFEFLEADSGGRDIDKRQWNVFASLRKPLNENYYLTLHQNNTWYNFSRLKQIYRQRFLVKLEYFDKPDFWASANYAHSIFSGQEGVRNTFGGEINFKPSDPWQLVLSHQRREVVDNSFTFANQLYRDDYKIRTIYRPNRRVSLGGDYMWSNYSDGNTRDEYGFDVSYYLFYEPRSLKATYRYEHYGFDRQNATYFTPSSFHCHIFGLQWKHFLNKEELFWGANDTFYTLGYETRFDYSSEHEVGHKIKVGFGHDWNDKCTSRVEWSKTIYETSSIYSENSLMFYTAFYF